MNGKGSRPSQFRENYEAINWTSKFDYAPHAEFIVATIDRILLERAIAKTIKNKSWKPKLFWNGNDSSKRNRV